MLRDQILELRQSVLDKQGQLPSWEKLSRLGEIERKLDAGEPTGGRGATRQRRMPGPRRQRSRV